MYVHGSFKKPMEKPMTIRKTEDPRLSGALVCLVTAQVEGVHASPPALVQALDALADTRSMEEFPPATLKDAVRGMLRAGGFKPAGRQKPASEYLAQSAREGRFPSINGPVDCNNLLSLETGLPISLLDADEIGTEALVRICDDVDATPLGNPVKDSMRGKLKDGTKHLAGFIYAPPGLYSPQSLRLLGERFAALLRDHCGAADARVVTVT